MGQPPRPEKAPSHFTAPIEFIVAKVSAAEPLIDQQFIEQLILEIADTRPKQRARNRAIRIPKLVDRWQT